MTRGGAGLGGDGTAVGGARLGEAGGRVAGSGVDGSGVGSAAVAAAGSTNVGASMGRGNVVVAAGSGAVGIIAARPPANAVGETGNGPAADGLRPASLERNTSRATTAAARMSRSQTDPSLGRLDG